MGRQLYLYIGTKREGPFGMAEVREMLEAGELDFEVECQPLGSARRRRLGDLFEVVPEADESEDGEDGHDEEEEPADGDDDEDEAHGGEARAPGEPPPGRLFYAGHPAILNYPLALLLAAGCAAGGYLLGPASLWYFLGGSGLAIGAILYILIDRSARQYLVTARRVEVIRGLVVKSSNEVRIRDIRTINVRRAGLRGFLGVGTVEFSSVGDAVDVAFENVAGPQRVKRIVRSLQDAGSEGGAR